MSGLSRIVSALTTGIATLLLGACASNAPDRNAAAAPQAHPARRVIVFVWDGMRPDSITEADTPHLAALVKRGTFFADNHSSYPTFTMMNAAAAGRVLGLKTMCRCSIGV